MLYRRAGASCVGTALTAKSCLACRSSTCTPLAVSVSGPSPSSPSLNCAACFATLTIAANAQVNEGEAAAIADAIKLPIADFKDLYLSVSTCLAAWLCEVPVSQAAAISLCAAEVP